MKTGWEEFTKLKVVSDWRSTQTVRSVEKDGFMLGLLPTKR